MAQAQLLVDVHARRPAAWRRETAAGLLPAAALFCWGAGLVLALGTVGADARWLGALGAIVTRHHAVPAGVPFAAAPSRGWHDVPVLAELLMHWLGGGDRGILAAQAAAVGSTLAAAAGLSPRRTWPAGLALLLGALPVLLVARADLFSLPLFALTCRLLRSTRRPPARALAAAIPLLALWANLHGGVLVGAELVAVFAAFELRNLVSRVAASAAVALAVCATPALWWTPSYYARVLSSAPAQLHVGLWARPSLSSGFTWLLLAGAVSLALAARPALHRYERVTALLLAAGTLQAERTGVWLLILLACAACDRSARRVRPRATRLALTAAAAAGLAAAAASSGRTPPAATAAVDRAVRLAGQAPILAPPDVAEEVVQRGGRVWISDPIDAFRLREQRAYLDWLAGRRDGDAALVHAAVVVAPSLGPLAAPLARSGTFRRAARAGSYTIFVRRRR
ncbi:MAG TPA: hypothetical protein VE982_02715 [Gaiellaceae bacterium]|nr:hypothetical protein [Gaiellaceae bacterium]